MIVGIVLIVVFLIVLFFGMPISMGMGIGTLASMIAGGYDFSTLPMLIQKGANSYTLISIPYFILAANIMNKGGITNRIFDFCESIVGWMHGGLAQVNVISSVIFAGISGTSSADAAGLGMVEIEAMDRLATIESGLSVLRWPRRFSVPLSRPVSVLLSMQVLRVYRRQNCLWPALFLESS